MNQLFNHIVLIDDDYASNYYHEIIITESNMIAKLSSFLSPVDALSYFEELAKKPDTIVPDLIFLDINMPMINGWEFLDELRQLPFKQVPPTVMLSTSSNPADIEKSTLHPMIIDYKVKPLDEDYIRKIYKEVMKQVA